MGRAEIHPVEFDTDSSMFDYGAVFAQEVNAHTLALNEITKLRRSEMERLGGTGVASVASVDGLISWSIEQVEQQVTATKRRTTAVFERVQDHASSQLSLHDARVLLRVQRSIEQDGGSVSETNSFIEKHASSGPARLQIRTALDSVVWTRAVRTASEVDISTDFAQLMQVLMQASNTAAYALMRAGLDAEIWRQAQPDADSLECVRNADQSRIFMQYASHSQVREAMECVVDRELWNQALMTSGESGIVVTDWKTESIQRCVALLKERKILSFHSQQDPVEAEPTPDIATQQVSTEALLESLDTDSPSHQYLQSVEPSMIQNVITDIYELRQDAHEGGEQMTDAEIHKMYLCIAKEENLPEDERVKAELYAKIMLALMDGDPEGGLPF